MKALAGPASIVLLFLLLAALPDEALGKGKGKKKSERAKLTKVLALTVDAHHRARHKDQLFKKGTLSPKTSGLRNKKLGGLFSGFSPQPYRKSVPVKTLIDQFLEQERQFQKEPVLGGVPIAFESAKILRLNLHREVATVESEVVLFDADRKSPKKGLHQVWVLEKKRWVLALRKAEVPKDSWAPDIGVVRGREWSDPGDGISANELGAKIEAAYLEGMRDNTMFDTTRVADFGRLTAVETLENHKRVRIRCGHMNVALLTSKDAKVDQIPLDSRVLFRGDVYQLNMKEPWLRKEYEAEGNAFYWKNIHVGLKNGEVVAAE